MIVQELMTKEVKSCKSDTTLHDAAISMWQNDCGCLPVVDAEGHPVGMVTDRDIVMGAALQHRPLWEISVGEIIDGHTLHSCSDKHDVRDALSVMQKYKIRRLPVVHDGGQLAGIVSIGDIVARADVRPKADLPISDTLTMLKSVTGHHGALVRVA